MIFETTNIAGVAIVDINKLEDERGFFARTFCQDEFAENGLLSEIVRCNISYNHLAGTLRGMHFQVQPATEAKFIRCLCGAMVDKIVDLRLRSPTYLQHVSVELTADNRRALYVPPMFARGYQALADQTEVFYQVSERYIPGTERGLRYDDPALNLH